jgi:iron complex transport system ATP-binding protein
MLTTHNLTLQINKKILCRNLNLDIQLGETWGILGPNGCGKTTLLQTLAGLKTPAKGEIQLQGKNIATLPRKYIARQLGILFQDTQDMFPQTVEEMCASGRYPHGSSIHDQMLTQQALHALDLTLLSKQSIQTLSGGERKRLNIATLLTQAPQIYLLDEPTNHLDLRYQIKILNHFKLLTQNKNAVTVMSLHDINLAAQYCQKILLLFENGEHLAGPTTAILNHENLTRLYSHPIQQIRANPCTWWQPSFNA